MDLLPLLPLLCLCLLTCSGVTSAQQNHYTAADGVRSKRYKAVRGDLPDPDVLKVDEAYRDFTADLAPLTTTLSISRDVPLVDSAFGTVQEGSPVSYPVPVSRVVIHHPDAPPPPPLPLDGLRLDPTTFSSSEESNYSTNMNHLVDLLCLCLLCLTGKTLCDKNEPPVNVEEDSDVVLPCSLSTKEDIEFKLFVWRKVPQKYEEPSKVIKVEEDSDVVLPCALSTKENITSGLFDWKKDPQRYEGQKEVFMYVEGIHYNNGLGGQTEEFKGRVSHFQDELKHGNASITIRNTKMADSGVYSCYFPRLQTPQIFYIKLDVVGRVLKDRSGENIPGPSLGWIILIVVLTPVAGVLALMMLVYKGYIILDQKKKFIKVKEGRDVTLPCSLSTKEDLTSKRFIWRKRPEERGEWPTVFLYEGQRKEVEGQDKHFQGRVEYFPEELKQGNVSIKIKKTTKADSGYYVCDHLDLQNPQLFIVQLVVVDGEYFD
ncbi:hypothetical protein FQN60_005264 [Etheostoma spectabile]|uniref:Ig-like domain-containing protein n=1 Tax=Etheostoma spectabile TaxID=54343 RepID=A0A5J5C8Q3_9PERO|nr:hypothetical protein FQN60_005264 [Etheostoma spectabile]